MTPQIVYLLNFYHKRRLGQIFTNIGLRASNNTLKSILSNEFYDFPYDEINLNTSSFSGNIGFRYNYKNSSFKFQYSNGFRSPNLLEMLLLKSVQIIVFFFFLI